MKCDPLKSLKKKKTNGTESLDSPHFTLKLENDTLLPLIILVPLPPQINGHQKWHLG